MISPEFFEINQCVYSTSISGYNLEVIDFNKADIRPEKAVDNFVGWEEVVR